MMLGIEIVSITIEDRGDGRSASVMTNKQDAVTVFIMNGIDELGVEEGVPSSFSNICSFLIITYWIFITFFIFSKATNRMNKTK